MFQRRSVHSPKCSHNRGLHLMWRSWANKFHKSSLRFLSGSEVYKQWIKCVRSLIPLIQNKFSVIPNLRDADRRRPRQVYGPEQSREIPYKAFRKRKVRSQCKEAFQAYISFIITNNALQWKRGRYLCSVPRYLTEVGCVYFPTSSQRRDLIRGWLFLLKEESQQLQQALQEEHYEGEERREEIGWISLLQTPTHPSVQITGNTDLCRGQGGV